MKKWKAIIFDMDGTLFDTERIAQEAWDKVANYYHIEIPLAFRLGVMGITMSGVPALWEKYMPQHLDMNEVFDRLHDYMDQYKLEYGPSPKADLHQLFDHLQEKGYKIALCSSGKKKAIEFNLNYVQIKERFDVIVDGGMTKNGKPHPDIYLLTASLLQIDPQDCLVVEDSRNGIYSGTRAGMDVVMIVDYIKPDAELKEITYQIIEHLDELKDIV